MDREPDAHLPDPPEDAPHDADADLRAALPPLFLPVVPGTPSESDALDALRRHARDAGVADPRIFGFAAVRFPSRVDAVHAAAGLVFAGIGAIGGVRAAVLGLAVVAVSAALRSISREGLSRLYPRAGSGVVVLRRPRTIRRVVVAFLDRARPEERRIPRIVCSALLLALIAVATGSGIGLASILLVVSGVRAWDLSRPHRVDTAAPEAASAEAVVRLAVRLDADGESDTAVLVAGRGALDAAGVRAFLDWYGLLPARGARSDLRCILVGGPRSAAIALRRAGLPPRIVSPSDVERL